MKFKVCDKVRVREDLEVGKDYGGQRFVKDMDKYKGEIYTIHSTHNGWYRLEEYKEGWFFTDEMLEPVEAKNCDMDKKIKDTIKTWDDWKIDEYNNNFAISKYSEKLPYNSEKNCDNCKNYNTYFDCSQCNDFDEWEEKEDLVNHPKHYTQGKYETIDIIEDVVKDLPPFEAVCVGNILRYITRYHCKNGLTDIEKARWYTDKLIDVYKGRSTCNF